MVLPLLYLSEIILIPGIVAVGLAYLTSRESRASNVTRGVPIEVESDLRNENMDPALLRIDFLLFFTIYYNLVYMTLNLSLVERTLFNSPYLYVGCLVAFLLAFFFALLFSLRFHERRYAFIGVIFLAIGSVVIFSTLQLGYGRWVSGASGGFSPGSPIENVVIPVALLGCSWVLAVVAFLTDMGLIPENLPFRFEGTKAYNILKVTLLFGVIGTCIAVLHPLMNLV